MKRLASCVVAVVFCASYVCAGTTTFSDGTFNDSDWTSWKHADTTSGNATYAADQVTTGGNPDEYRRIQHNWTGDGGLDGLDVAHVKNTAIYDPAAGEITTIDFSLDVNYMLPDIQPGAIGFYPLLTQGGNVYAIHNAANTHAWVHLDLTDLTQTSFRRRNTDRAFLDEYPDFSTSGGVIQFGYLTSNGTNFSQSVTANGGIDNWSVTVNQVPEPSTVASLLSMGIIGLIGFWWRRRKAA